MWKLCICPKGQIRFSLSQMWSAHTEHSSAMFPGLGVSLDHAISALRSVTVAKGTQPPHARPSNKQPSGGKGVVDRYRQAILTWDTWGMDETREKAASRVGS